MNRLLALISVPVALVAFNVTAASAWDTGYGPPPHAPAVTCTTISVDPPSVSYIKVTFTGTINDVPFTKTVSYGAPTPHIASADISDLTTALGPLHIVAHATWTLGDGDSKTVDITITCHQASTTTTTTIPKTTTTSASTTTTSTAPETTTVVTEGTTVPPTVPPTTSTTIALPPNELPNTGGPTGTIAFVGSCLVLAGTGLVVRARRNAR